MVIELAQDNHRLLEVTECLDRVVANQLWMNMFPEARVVNIGSLSSDHLAVSVKGIAGDGQRDQSNTESPHLFRLDKNFVTCSGYVKNRSWEYIWKRIFEDPWVMSLPGYRIPAISGHVLSNSLVAELIDMQAGCWKAGVIDELFPTDIAQAIKEVLVGLSRCTDWWAWAFNKKGLFTVKSAYKVAFHARFVDDNPAVGSNSACRRIWSLNAPQKLKMFLWHACIECLPTRLNLAQKGMEIDTTCPICEAAPESRLHALSDCPGVRIAWHRTSVNQSLPQGYSQFKDWCFDSLERLSKIEMEELVSLMYFLWTNRSMGQKSSQLDLYPELLIPTCRSSEQPFRIQARLPRATQQEVGSRRNGSSLRGLTVDWELEAVVGEALAIKAGLVLAKSVGVERVIMESDCKELIDMLRTGAGDLSLQGKIIEECLALMGSFPEVQYSCIFREANRVAHEIALHVSECNSERD
ncbi:hypothetical protein Droror1_Dr00022223 [Drosera rotundifolia]